MTRLDPSKLALMYGSLIAYLADFAFSFCIRPRWSPRTLLDFDEAARP